MESFGNERRIQQGEDFNLDLLLSQNQEEYVPFVVSSERENPMFVITVASTKFEKNERYVESWWLDLNKGYMDVNGDMVELPRFFQTVPQDLGILPTMPNTRADLPGTSTDQPMQNLYQFRLPETHLNYLNPLTGEGIYWVYIRPDDTLDFNYECRIRFNLTSIPTAVFNEIRGDKGAGTSNWGSQNYMYQITLVSGQLMKDAILQAKDAFPTLNWPRTWPVQGIDNNGGTWPETATDFEQRVIQYIEDNRMFLYDFIKQRQKDYFQPDIDWDSPLGQIWVPQVIMPPTKLQVDNNLRIII